MAKCCPITSEELEKYFRSSEAIPGWTRGDEAYELARVCFTPPADAHIVAIGAFLDSGTILLAGARHLPGSGLVHCVDPFDCSGDAVRARRRAHSVRPDRAAHP